MSDIKTPKIDTSLPVSTSPSLDVAQSELMVQMTVAGAGSSESKTVQDQLAQVGRDLEGLTHQLKGLDGMLNRARGQLQASEANRGRVQEKAGPKKKDSKAIGEAQAEVDQAARLVQAIEGQVTALKTSADRLKQTQNTLQTVSLPHATQNDRRKAVEQAQAAGREADRQQQNAQSLVNQGQQLLKQTAHEDWRQKFSGGGAPPPPTLISGQQEPPPRGVGQASEEEDKI